MERRAAITAALNPVDAGDGILLHPATVADTSELYALIDTNRAHLREWLPWLSPSYNLDDARLHLVERERENAARRELTCMIRQDGVLRGAVGLHRIDALHRNTSIGYWLDGAFGGRGIMTRACRALITEGFAGYGLHRIEIRCATGNVRSAAIPLRLEFREEGILRDAEWLYDRWVDLRVFSMLEQDWR